MQTVGSYPTRLDRSHLSADDVAQIERLAGGRFWLLIDHARTDFEVYGLPDTTGPAVRRGRMVWVVVPLANSPALPNSDQRTQRQWRRGIAPGSSWAQVALPGLDFDDVGGAEDPNRPFRVAGAFRDAELVALVEFVRSGPELRDTNGTRAVKQGCRSWPSNGGKKAWRCRCASAIRSFST